MLCRRSGGAQCGTLGDVWLYQLFYYIVFRFTALIIYCMLIASRAHRCLHSENDA